jgi:hypothetical protein
VTLTISFIAIMTSEASKCHIRRIAKTIISDFSHGLVRERWDSSICAVGLIVGFSSVDGIGEWSSGSTEVDGRRYEVDMVVEELRETVCFSSNNVALSVGVDSIFGLEHFFSQ